MMERGREVKRKKRKEFGTEEQRAAEVAEKVGEAEFL
jgi:hypothetical protein